MKNFPKSKKVYLLVFAALIVFLFFLDIRNFVIVDPKGRVVAGSKFNVSIGSAVDLSAGEVLKFSSVKYGGEGYGGECAGNEYGKEFRVVYFFDLSWRRGVICIISEGDIVREISWEYQFISALP
jgi:hypothetical protein